MTAWLLLTAVLAAGPEEAWTPAEAPPPTPWAKAGARGWRICREAEQQARAVRESGGPRGGFEGEEGLWRRRAQQCPHAVYLLVLAAELEIVEAGDLFMRIDPQDEFGQGSVERYPIDDVVSMHRAQVERALAWLDAAIAESARRGQRPPQETHYYRGYALLALGRIEEAGEAIDRAIATGDVERWRAERMGALIDLFAGDIHSALRRAERGVYDARPEARPISRYMRALVLDRAGASDEAKAELVALPREGPFVRGAMETVLPIHERLYFRALDHQANGNRSAALRMWELYLARPEPAEPERVLARRHLDELTPSPPPVGGP